MDKAILIELREHTGSRIRLMLSAGGSFGVLELEGELTLVRDQVVVVLPSGRELPEQARAEATLFTDGEPLRLEGVAHRLSSRALRLVILPRTEETRRQYVRIDISLPAAVSAVSLGASATAVDGPWHCRVANVSMGGARILLPLQLPRLSVLRVTLLAMPGHGDLDLLAHVRSVDPAPDGRYSTGVQWLPHAPEALEPIRSLVLSRLDQTDPEIIDVPTDYGDLIQRKLGQTQQLLLQVQGLLRLARNDPRHAYDAWVLTEQGSLLFQELRSFLAAAAPNGAPARDRTGV